MSDESEYFGMKAKEGFLVACNVAGYTPEPKELDNENWKNIGFWSLQSPVGTLKDLAQQIAKICNTEPKENSLIAWEAAVVVLYSLIADPEERFNIEEWLATRKQQEGALPNA